MLILDAYAAAASRADVEDCYRSNSWLGIEDLAENIGEMPFDVVK